MDSSTPFLTVATSVELWTSNSTAPGLCVPDNTWCTTDRESVQRKEEGERGEGERGGEREEGGEGGEGEREEGRWRRRGGRGDRGEWEREWKGRGSGRGRGEKRRWRERGGGKERGREGGGELMQTGRGGESRGREKDRKLTLPKNTTTQCTVKQTAWHLLPGKSPCTVWMPCLQTTA